MNVPLRIPCKLRRRGIVLNLLHRPGFDEGVDFDLVLGFGVAGHFGLWLSGGIIVSRGAECWYVVVGNQVDDVAQESTMYTSMNVGTASHGGYKSDIQSTWYIHVCTGQLTINNSLRALDTVVAWPLTYILQVPELHRFAELGRPLKSRVTRSDMESTQDAYEKYLRAQTQFKQVDRIESKDKVDSNPNCM